MATATRLMLLRAELTQLVGERRTLGDLTPIGLPDLRKPRPVRRAPIRRRLLVASDARGVSLPSGLRPRPGEPAK